MTTDLITRIEQAGEEEQHPLLDFAWRKLRGDEYTRTGINLFYRFRDMLDAHAYLSAAEMLVPDHDDRWLEIKGPRKYLNIPTPSPNYWSALLATFSNERHVTGWGATPALALAAACLKAHGEMKS